MRFYGMLKVSTSMKQILIAKLTNFWPSFSCVATRLSADYCQRALVFESGMIRTHMGSTVDQ
jgi:hypothetical protein